MKRISLILLAILVGCSVDKAVAPRDNVVPMQLRTFPKQDWRLVNNKFFLWREDMTPQHASRAIAIGREIDDLDGKALPLNRRHLELDEKMGPLQDAINEASGNLAPIQVELSQAAKKKDDTLTLIPPLEQKLQIEKGKPQPDQAQIAALTQQIGGLRAQVAAAQAKIDELTPKKAALEQTIATKQTELDPLKTELTDLEARQLVIETAGRERVDELMTVVDWYKDQPTAVTFQFERDGRISASMLGWNLGDDAGARNFSTESAGGIKPTMGNVTYAEVGGTFEFDVWVYVDEAQTQLRETFHFKVSRIKYDYPDGRLFFGGEITKTSADGKVRRGLAKLVDRNN